MIYLPWVVFLVAIFWMIREGSRAKKEHTRRRREEELSRSSDQSTVEARSITHASSQGQASELTGALAGDGQRRIAGFLQQGKR